MKRPVALGLVGILFLVGALVGVVGTHLFYLQRVAEPGGVADLVLGIAGDRLANRLDLRPDQRQAFDAVLADTRDQIALAREDFVVDLKAIRARSAQRVEAVLDPEQLQELRRIREEEGALFDRFLDE